jgi:F-type H+-transporting ATPase subunit delta
LALWNGSAQLREAMASPVLEPDAKKAALAALFDEQVTPSVQNLLKLLADRQRIAVLDAVLERFLELYRELRHITLAKVSSATPLSEEQQAQLNQKVQAIAGTKAVEFDLNVDPSLIGGFVVNLGSQVIDASLVGQVRRLGLALAKV